MTRVVCQAYGSGLFHGTEFREELVGGVLVGVALVSDEDLGWFRARSAFVVPDPKSDSKPKAEPKKAPKK